MSTIWIHFTLCLETKAITKSRTLWLQIATSTLKQKFFGFSTYAKHVFWACFYKLVLLANLFSSCTVRVLLNIRMIPNMVNFVEAYNS